MFPAEPSPQMLLLHDSLIWGLPGSAKWVRYQCLQSNWLLGKELSQEGWKWAGVGEGAAVACPGNLLKEVIRAVCFSCLWMWSLVRSKEWNESELDADDSEAVATAGCSEWAVLER